MSVRKTVLGLAVLMSAAPVAGQERWTVEFGAFAAGTAFDSGLGLNNGLGAGGRVGVFLDPRLSMEFEASGSEVDRSLALRNVSVEVLSARLTAVPLRTGPLSVLVGAGVDHTDTYMIESYGVQALLGAKYALSEMLALRVDAVESYMLNGNYSNPGLRAGLSLYLNRLGRGNPTGRFVTAAPLSVRQDSVGVAETRRRGVPAAGYRMPSDVIEHFDPEPASSAVALATMQEMIYFENDRSDLSIAAKAILSDKVTVFRANPAMRIVIVGFASEPGTTTYNLALGLRRAEAAREYLISQGVTPIRIEIETRGEAQLAVEGPGEYPDAANRRGQFRLLIADPYLVAPPR